MICTLHGIWNATKGERPDGVCRNCRLESYVIMKQWSMLGILPPWVTKLPCWLDLKQ